MRNALSFFFRSFLLLLLFWQWSTATEQVIRYHSIIVGINDYDHWGDLRRAKKDAQSLEQILSSIYEFDTITSLYDGDASAAAIEETFRNVIPELGEQDALFIFFSGHGYYDELLDQGFWIPSDARLDVDGQPAVRDWVENDRIKQYLSKCAAKHVLVVSDACFSGALFKGGSTGINPTTMLWYQHVVEQPSRWAITSGDMEMVPDAGVFGMKLLQLLKFPPRDIFSVSDLAGWLKKEVSAFDGTLPLAGPLHDANHKMGGEFVFVQKGIENDFWRLQATRELNDAELAKGQVLCYSNLESQVYLDGTWVGFVNAGESLLIDSVIPGERELSVKSTAGLFNRKLQVMPDSVTHANAVFYANEQRTQISRDPSGVVRSAVVLSMDAENDPLLTGIIENRGALVTRDAIRGNALRFQQRASMVYQGGGLSGVGASDFSVSLWIKWMGDVGGEASILSSFGKDQGIELTVHDGHLVLATSSFDSAFDQTQELRSPAPFVSGFWHHIVFLRKGGQLELWQDGEKMDFKSHSEPLDLSDFEPIVFGFNPRRNGIHFTGLMDEVSFDDQALSAEDIQDRYQLKYEKYRVTRKRYSEREDLDLIAKKLYGGSARLADWNEILSRFGGELDEFWSYLGVEAMEPVWVTYLNRRFFNSARHFYALKCDDAEAIDDEVHERAAIDEGDLVLSSWVNLEIPMLVEL